jgi:hypothetical protein
VDIPEKLKVVKPYYLKPHPGMRIRDRDITDVYPNRCGELMNPPKGNPPPFRTGRKSGVRAVSWLMFGS